LFLRVRPFLFAPTLQLMFPKSASSDPPQKKEREYLRTLSKDIRGGLPIRQGQRYSTPMAALRFLDDAGRIQTSVLDSEHFVIGRAPSCQLVLDSDMISREHLRLDLAGEGRFRIRDLGSRNKTFVNGEQINETLLNPGDIIRAGDRVLEFLDDAVSHDRIALDFLTPQRAEPPDCEWVKLKAPVSLTVAQLEQLAQLVGDQPLLARPEDVASAALSSIVHDLQADRGFLALRGEGKNELYPIAHRALKRTAGVPFTPVSQAFAVAPLVQQAAGRYPQSAGDLDVKLGYAVTAVVAPLTARGEVVGVLYVDRPASRKPFPASALQYCLAAGATLGASLSESTRKLARSAVREGAAWMTTIRRLQALFTNVVPQSDSFDCTVSCFAGKVRCGDFATVVALDRQRCFVVVLDGGGRGVAGIAQCHAVQSAIRATVAAAPGVLMDPAGVFNTLNQMIAASPARQVLPCLYAAIDTTVGKLAYINAGGASPMLLGGHGRVVGLDKTSLVLGVDKDYSYELNRVDLPDAFRLICVTDGFVESVNAGGEPMGDQRIRQTLVELEDLPSAAEILSKIGETWSAHMGGSTGDDDALALVLGYGR